jgi:hypothetical protein
MKEIKITLDDKEYNKLIKIKGDLTWKQLLLTKLEENEDGKTRTKNN